MRIPRSVVALALCATVALVSGTPAQASQHSATPVPGRFCKAAEAGKKVKTAKYGTLRCTKVGSRARWVKL